MLVWGHLNHQANHNTMDGICWKPTRHCLGCNHMLRNDRLLACVCVCVLMHHKVSKSYHRMDSTRLQRATTVLLWINHIIWSHSHLQMTSLELDALCSFRMKSQSNRSNHKIYLQHIEITRQQNQADNMEEIGSSNRGMHTEIRRRGQKRRSSRISGWIETSKLCLTKRTSGIEGLIPIPLIKHRLILNLTH